MRLGPPAECSGDRQQHPLSVDGARRGDGAAAAGVALFAVSASGSEVVLCRAGRILGNVGSAFVAELLALEWGLDVYTNHIDKGVFANAEVAGRR